MEDQTVTVVGGRTYNASANPMCVRVLGPRIVMPEARQAETPHSPDPTTQPSPQAVP